MDILVDPAHRDPTQSDLYIVRGLLRCGADPMIPARTAGGTRGYACPDRTCDRFLNAEEIEQQVWRRYVQLNADAADIVSRDRRRSALLAVLARVTVGSSLADVDYDWRD
ncbi:zinc ribbon domain-containing protein [Solwaraspora sp. WMMD406]|uniref:zinc ribbon domain-containing protein n=1 Tax=Solwaraspora sp. WMMD406 TaxID=3016095 RepID=UPI002416B222|nr:zinc ribbon domain-containing protein [Solwaraspora sp. WMMD406]MDG4766661.1 zinc ribbon domain-containing protein [Solwaraspora sp. WMMD406]